MIHHRFYDLTRWKATPISDAGKKQFRKVSRGSAPLQKGLVNLLWIPIVNRAGAMAARRRAARLRAPKRSDWKEMGLADHRRKGHRAGGRWLVGLCLLVLAIFCASASVGNAADVWLSSTT